LLAGVAALAITGGILIYLNRTSPSAIPSEALAQLTPVAQAAARRLVDEPCNRILAADLVSDLLDKAEYAVVIAFSAQTETKCGSNEEMLPSLFAAQEQSSDFVGAERTSEKLIAEDPADPSAYAWRGEARENRHDFVGAYADYRASLSLFPDPSNVDLSAYYDVARLAAKAGHPCDAVLTLRDFIAFAPEERRTQQLATLMANWQRQGACPSLSGTGTALLRFDPNVGAIVISAEVNGVSARLIVDTGATRTVVSKDFASRAGIKASDVQGATVDTANGRIWVSGGRADYISLGEARLNGVPMFIETSTNSSFGDNIDGLLGLSFLGNFHVQINDGALELRPLE
jgi:aspartyl protease family protein